MGININAQYNGFVYEPSKYKSSPLPAIGTSQNLNKPQSSSSAIITKPEIEEIDLFRYDDNPTEVFSKTNLDKNDFGIKTEVEADTSSFLDVLKSTGATVAVGATTILSGTWKLNEMLGDGAVWLLGTAASGVLDLFNQDEIADYIKQETKDFIARDMIGEANELFYEKTAIGRAINEASYLKYDSETAQKIQKVSTVATELVAATALTVATGGAAAPVAAAMVIGTGFVAGVGESAEKRYQDPNNDSYDTGAILLDGIGNGFEWYATGKLGQGALSMFQAVGQSVAQTGVKGTVKFFKNMAIDKLKQFNIKNLFNIDFYKKSLKNGLLDFDQLIDSVSMGVDNITSAINSGEKLDWGQFTKEILGSYALNCAFDGFTNLFSKNLGNVDNFVQKVDEAKTGSFDKLNIDDKANSIVDVPFEEEIPEYLQQSVDAEVKQKYNSIADVPFGEEIPEYLQQSVNTEVKQKYNSIADVPFGEEIPEYLQQSVDAEVKQKYNSIVDVPFGEKTSKYEQRLLEKVEKNITQSVTTGECDTEIVVKNFEDIRLLSEEVVLDKKIKIGNDLYEINDIKEYLDKVEQKSILLDKKNVFINDLVNKYNISKENVLELLKLSTNFSTDYKEIARLLNYSSINSSQLIDQLDLVCYKINEDFEKFLYDTKISKNNGINASLAEFLNIENSLSKTKSSKPLTVVQKEFISKFNYCDSAFNFVKNNQIDMYSLSVDSRAILKKAQVSPLFQKYGIQVSEKANISIADIVGYGEEYDGENILTAVNNYFRDKGDGYHTRSTSMLSYNSDNVISGLSESFMKEPISVKEDLDGKYTVHTNGKHRYTLMRILYLNESLNIPESELLNLNKKYTIPVELSKYDKTKTYCNYILHNYFDDYVSIEYDQYRNATGKVILSSVQGALDNDELISCIKEKILKLSNNEITNMIEYSNSEVSEFIKSIIK